MRLAKVDWERLDSLLGQVGFGGYYDLVEVLKTIVTNLKPSVAPSITGEADLHNLIMLITALSEEKKKRETK